MKFLFDEFFLKNTSHLDRVPAAVEPLVFVGLVVLVVIDFPECFETDSMEPVVAGTDSIEPVVVETDLMESVAAEVAVDEPVVAVAELGCPSTGHLRQADAVLVFVEAVDFD